MISQTAEYALRATVYLAAQGPNPQRTSDISESTKVPQAYLAKVLQGLASKGLVVMRRGVGGGVRLAKPSAELTIFDIVDAIAPIERVSKCPISESDQFCSLHDRLNEAIGHVENAYRSTTLADLVNNQCRPALCTAEASSETNVTLETGNHSNGSSVPTSAPTMNGSANSNNNSVHSNPQSINSESDRVESP